MKQTIVQKILSMKTGRNTVDIGDIVEVEPDLAMSHDNAGLVIKQFFEIGTKKVWNSNSIVIILDHRIPAESVKTANTHKTIREFVKQQNIKLFYDIREGICHQIMVEKGHILPGLLVIGTDSHTTSYGCLGSFSTGVGATEMAAVWATGHIWFKVPKTIKIIVNGHFRAGVYAKDLILYIIGQLKSEGANYYSIEFEGDTISRFSISERFTLCNLSTEMGAKCAFVHPDKTTRLYLKKITNKPYKEIYSDKNASYSKIYEFDADMIVPQISCPHQVDHVKAVDEISGKRIHQAVIGSCTNGRLDDFQVVSEILKGKKIHSDVRMIIIPASRTVYSQLLRRGIIKIFLDSGCVICNPGCGPCLGAHQGILADNETCIATTNRNFRGRMGSPKSEIFLASPATVAQSALAGMIVSTR